MRRHCVTVSIEPPSEALKRVRKPCNKKIYDICTMFVKLYYIWVVLANRSTFGFCLVYKCELVFCVDCVCGRRSAYDMPQCYGCRCCACVVRLAIS